MNLSKKEIADILYKKIVLTSNDPSEDRKSVNFSVNYIINSQLRNKICLDFPVRVLWKITGKCNCKCKHCWATISNTEVEKDKLIKVAKEIADNNVFLVSLSGGEPLLNKNLYDIIKILKSKNIVIEIMSNGSLITEEVANKLKEHLDLNTDTVQISLDGSNSQIHDIQRGKPIFQKTVNGIKNLVKNGVNVRVAYTATGYNVKDIYNTYKLCNDLGVKVMSISPVFPFRKGVSTFKELDDEKYNEQIAKCILDEENMMTKLRIQVNQSFQKLILENKNLSYYPIDKNNLILKPYETNSSIQIDALGNLLPGPEWDTNFSGGNVYLSGIKPLWDKGQNWEEFRKGRNLNNTKCSNCKIYRICYGGNMKLAYENSGTINNSDGTCKYEKMS